MTDKSQGAAQRPSEPIPLNRRRRELPIIVEDPFPLLPEGEYTLAYVRHEYTAMFKGRTKLVVVFRVVDMGEHFGTLLRRYYNVRKVGKRYHVGASTDLAREMAALFGKGATRRGTDFGQIASALIVGEVATVTVDANNRRLADVNRYSRVARLQRLAD